MSIASTDKLITLSNLSEFKSKYTDKYVGALTKLVNDAAGKAPGAAGYTTTTGLATVKEYVDNAVANAGSDAVVTVEKLTTADTGFVATYVVKQNGTAVGDKINIPKDYLVKSGTLETCATADSPVTGLAVGDKYLDFVVNTVGNDETAQHIYIPVNDLFDSYTSGSAATDEVVVTVDNSTNKITASITNGTVTKDQLVSTLSTEISDATSAIGVQSNPTKGTVGTGIYKRLEDLEAVGAQANVLESVKVNGTALTIDSNKAVDVTVVTGATDGTLAVNGVDVAVKGLGSMAYETKTDYVLQSDVTLADNTSDIDAMFA